MSILLRSLLFLSLSGMFLAVAPLRAEEPPRLTAPKPLPPRPNTSNGTLEGLSALASGTANVGQKVKTTGTTQPVPCAQTEYSRIQTPEQLPPPNPISQASFAAFTSPKSSEVPVHEELPPDSFYEPENEALGIPHEMLDRVLLSKKAAGTKEELTEEENGEEPRKTGGWKNKLAKPELTPIVSVGGSLLIVVAAFFLLAVLLRKVSPKGNRPLPKEAFECLGRYFLTQKHQLQVLRLGNRIVLVSVMPDGVSTLAEITDPDEAVSFLGLCRRLDTNSATEMFRKTIASMSEDELSRPHERPVVTTRRRGQSASSLDLYSDPDESLAAMMIAKGRHHGR